MKHLVKALFMCFLLFGHLHSAAQCRLDKSGWVLEYAEEFSGAGTSSILSNGWVVGQVSGSASPNLKYSVCEDANKTKEWTCADPEMVEVRSGYCYLGASKTSDFPCDGVVAKGKSGIITSTHDDFPGLWQVGTAGSVPGYAFGMFEVRCKLPASAPTYPAFWLCGSNSWPPEIDVFEYHGGTDNFFSTVHWGNKQNCGNTYVFKKLDLTKDFHTFTLVWTPTQMTWFLDGVELKTDNDPTHTLGRPHIESNLISEFFRWNRMHLFINNDVQCPASTEQGSYDPLIVDYVHVYRPRNYQPYSAGNWSSLEQYYHSHLSPLYARASYKSATDWKHDIIESRQYTAVDVRGNLHGFQGGEKFVYTGPDSKLWTTYWSNGYSSKPLANSPVVEGRTALARSGEMIFFQRGSKAFYYSSNSSFPIHVATDVHSEITPGPGGEEFYYRTTSNHLAYCRKQLGQWKKLTITERPCLGDIIMNQRGDVQFRSNDNNIYQAHFNGTAFALQAVTNTADVSAVLAADATGRVFYKSRTGTLRQSIFNRGTNTWAESDFKSHVQGGSSAVALTNVQSDLVISKDTQNFQFFYLGNDQRVWAVWFDGQYNDFSATPISPFLNNALSNLSLILDTANPAKNHLCYVGADLRIHTIEWTRCENLNPRCHTSSGDVEITSDEEASSWTLYPNPGSNMIYLQCQSACPEKELVVQLVDVQGRLISRQVAVVDGNSRIELPVAHLLPGIYAVVMLIGQKTLSWTWVKE